MMAIVGLSFCNDVARSKPQGSTLLRIKFDDKEKVSEHVRDRNLLLSAVIKKVFFSAIFRNTFFIPAERQGIALLNKELSLIKNKSFDRLLSNGKRQEMLTFFESRFNRYPKSTQYALEFMQNLDYSRTQKTAFTTLADELDQLFFGGRIHLNEQD